ncbi:efflux RND transporter periplasmic adaptor subunit [Roseibacillus ishigakijimensis]|uniref:efflux RND transporter periplasmic adaptor subunit n=1 Tax=Roseibacillus ishigakijimensis TaxID=454146 RepID=UPI00190571CD|nr:efflux RND transporter periplasmic adaptor subunit [Roseibacillus ishigakijimensis]
MAGFLFVFALLFGERLLPAVPVRTVQVVTLRSAASAPAALPATDPARSPDSAATAASDRSLLFQASGWLEPDPYIIEVPVLVSGVVDEVPVLDGQLVEEGQLLATLDDEEATLALEKAERRLATMRSQIAAHCSMVPEVKARIATAGAKVTAAEARLAELQDVAERLANLPPGAASVSEVTAARLQVERQRAVLAEAQSEIPRLQAELETIDYQRVMMGHQFGELETERDLARLALERHRITSPLSGRILHLHVKPGKKRMLDGEDPKSAVVVELYQPEKMQARIDVPLNEAAALAVGQEVELVTDLLPEVTLLGTVTRITGEADIARNTLQAKVSISNPDDRLRPEMLVRAKFYPPAHPPQAAAPTGEDAPSAPPTGSGRLILLAAEEALFDIRKEQAQAWVVSPDSTAQRRTLTLGPERRENYREVREGLRSGEQLILPPFSELAPGARVAATPSNF